MEQEMEYSMQVKLTPLYLYWRKGMDVTFGLLGMIVLLLLLPVIALLIFLDSPGPIFYKQERVGYLRKKFVMYKFRSMQVTADRSGNADRRAGGSAARVLPRARPARGAPR